MTPFLALALAGCAARPHPHYMAIPVVQPLPAAPAAPAEHLSVPIVSEKTVPPCVKKEQIPDEPPSIAEKLTGIARYDVGPLAQSARELREALRKARELLLKCAARA